MESKTTGTAFPDISREMTVLGHVFTVEPGDVESIEAAHELAARLESIDLRTIEPGAYRSFANEIMDAIDALVQTEGASRDVIFAGRRVNLIHLTAAFAQAMSAVTGGFDASLESVMSEFTTVAGE